MNRARNGWIGLISAAAAILIVYGIYVVQMQQIELSRTVNVLVPASFIPSGTLLSNDMMEWKSVTEGMFHEGMITRMEDAQGMENIVPLGEAEPILRWKLDKFRLLPTAGQSTFQIPRDYVLSISSEIRAGDEVDLFISSPASNAASRKLFSHSLKVATVKSATGLEVDDEQGSYLLSGAQGDKERMYASRKSNSGIIDRINLNLTEDQWLTIDRLCKDGSTKLVIAFTPSSIREVNS